MNAKLNIGLQCTSCESEIKRFLTFLGKEKENVGLGRFSGSCDHQLIFLHRLIIKERSMMMVNNINVGHLADFTDPWRPLKSLFAGRTFTETADP